MNDAGLADVLERSKRRALEAADMAEARARDSGLAAVAEASARRARMISDMVADARSARKSLLDGRD